MMRELSSNSLHCVFGGNECYCQENYHPKGDPMQFSDRAKCWSLCCDDLKITGVDGYMFDRVMYGCEANIPPAANLKSSKSGGGCCAVL